MQLQKERSAVSAKVMGDVWGLALPREQKFVLISLADHADHEGNHVYPSLGLISWKTDYSERQVRRIMSELETAGIIIPTNRQSGQTTEYRIELSHVAKKATRVAQRGRPVKANKPPSADNKTPDILSQPAITPDILSQEKEKTPDILTLNPGHSSTSTPDILTHSPYSLYEPSEEPSEEPKKEREDAPLAPLKKSRLPKPSPVYENPPSLGEIRALCLTQGWPELAEEALDFQSQRGWMMKSGPVTDWPSAVRTWKRNKDYYATVDAARNGANRTPALPPLGVSALEVGSNERQIRFAALRARQRAESDAGSLQ
jgi:hypothetical protein